MGCSKLVLLLLLGVFRVRSQCTAAFHDLQAIRNAITSPPLSMDNKQLLFNFTSFACNTAITGWIFAGRSNPGDSTLTTLYPEIQVWRLDSILSQYLRISTTNASTPPSLVESSPSMTEDSLYEYTLDSPLTVMAGDVLGIRIPPATPDIMLPNTVAGILPLFVNSPVFDPYFVVKYLPTPTFVLLTNSQESDHFPLVTPVLLSNPSSISTTITSTMSATSSPTSSQTDATSSSLSSQTNSVATTMDGSPTTTNIMSTIQNPLPSLSTIQTPLPSLSTIQNPLPSLSTIQTPLPSLATTTSSGISVLRTFTTFSPSNIAPPSTVTTSSSSSSVVVGIGSGNNNNNPPAAVIAGSVIAVVLVVVIIVLVFVLVLLFSLGKKNNNSKDEIAYPPNGYVEAGSPFDNPNYTPMSKNVQLVGAQSTSSTMTGEQFVSHYEVPGFSDPIGSPIPYYESKPGSMGSSRSAATNAIYGDDGFDDAHYELDPFSNSRTVLINSHYEMESQSSLPRLGGQGPVDPANHYEMEFSDELPGIACSYEKPVSSKNSTMIRHYEDPQVVISQLNVVTPLAPHEYSVLDGNIFVPSEEERRLMRQRSAMFDESSYAQLGDIQKKRYEKKFEKPEVYWKPATQASVLYDQLSKRKFREIPRSQLHITKHLGSGNFGTVNEGVWTTTKERLPVALKLVSPNASETDKVKLLQEGAIMGQFEHKNVVGLHGMVTVGEPVMVVIELMPRGDLRNHLKSIRQEMVQSADSLEVPKQLLQFCREVAQGMSYFSEKSFVHRDLAARNIFLTPDLVCKIGDFGMSRDLEDENYYVSHGGKIPVKWTAPEAIQYKKYSTLSDVWSYAALMYEIWSLAHKPFEGFSNPQTIDLVQSGYRLPPPPGCPRMMYQLMIHCWHPDSSRRPTFADIVNELSEQPKRLLSWRDMDKCVHVQASVLGAPLEAGQDLYPELQQTFIRSTIKIN